MKARVKATGEIVEIVETDFAASNGMIYDEEDLIISKDEPDYWTKLHHQAAIAAMQGILNNSDLYNNLVSGVSSPDIPKVVAARSYQYATAIVKTLK